jgi:hypothetical protein
LPRAVTEYDLKKHIDYMEKTSSCKTRQQVIVLTQKKALIVVTLSRHLTLNHHKVSSSKINSMPLKFLKIAPNRRGFDGPP